MVFYNHFLETRKKKKIANFNVLKCLPFEDKEGIRLLEIPQKLEEILETSTSNPGARGVPPVNKTQNRDLMEYSSRLLFAVRP